MREPTEHSVDHRRRDILRFGLALGLAVVASPLDALGALRNDRERALSFDNRHTGERLTTVYWAQGEYVPEGLTAIDKLLRDFRTDDVHPIEPRLLDLLFEVRGALRTNRAFEVISGYRSPRTNKTLRRHRRGIASQSFHTLGMAIDVVIPGRSVRDLRRVALSMRRGGVGFYPRAGFVHLDVGPSRSW